MIVSSLFGGLGNQMFQYACGKALALQNKVKLDVDCQYFNENDQKKKGGTIRQYELSCFQLKTENIGSFRRNILVPFVSLQNKYVLAMNYYLNPFYIKEVERFKFQKLPSFKNVYLYGYWQSWKYFSDFENIIRNDFKFRNPLSGMNLKIANKIKETNSISVHVRLGDYNLEDRVNTDYYTKAIELIHQKLSDVTFFVFSDEPQLAKEYFKGEQYEIINWNFGNESYYDMHLISLCKHHVIANSSFSWWGAWLSQTPEKIVIAPERWNKANPSTVELIPASWFKI